MKILYISVINVLQGSPLKDNSYYIVIKEGKIVGFSDYYSSSPRELPVGALIKTGETKEHTRIYDGMPVTTTSQWCYIGGFKKHGAYKSESMASISGVIIEDEYLREITKDEFNKRGKR